MKNLIVAVHPSNERVNELLGTKFPFRPIRERFSDCRDVYFCYYSCELGVMPIVDITYTLYMDRDCKQEVPKSYLDDNIFTMVEINGATTGYVGYLITNDVLYKNSTSKNPLSANDAIAHLKHRRKLLEGGPITPLEKEPVPIWESEPLGNFAKELTRKTCTLDHYLNCLIEMEELVETDKQSLGVVIDNAVSRLTAMKDKLK